MAKLKFEKKINRKLNERRPKDKNQSKKVGKVRLRSLGSLNKIDPYVFQRAAHHLNSLTRLFDTLNPHSNQNLENTYIVIH